MFFFRSFYEVGKKLNSKDRLAYYDAILRYAFEDITPLVTGIAEIGFISAKPILDSDKQKYLNGQKAAGFGKLGGRPKKENNPQGLPKENPQGFEEKTPNKNKNIKQEQEQEYNTPVAPSKGGATHIPPTFEEVKAYIAEKGYNVDAEKFYAFYSSNGWKVGRNPMKNWKQAVVSWKCDRAGYNKPSQDYVSRTQIPDREVFKYVQGTI